MATNPKFKNDFAPLEAQVQAHLGQKLRTLYADVLTEGVPDRFTALLDRLEASESTSSVSGMKS